MTKKTLVAGRMQSPKGKRQHYLKFRREYEPRKPRLVVIAESPPTSRLYFYNPNGACSEPLFAALMWQLHLSPLTKEDGLRAFQQRGWLLVDATYEPVNDMSRSRRNDSIERDYALLCSDLAASKAGRSCPLILIKANVCRVLEPKLAQDGFNVLNRGRVIYFPSTGHQNAFRRQFRAVLKSAGI